MKILLYRKLINRSISILQFNLDHFFQTDKISANAFIAQNTSRYSYPNLAKLATFKPPQLTKKITIIQKLFYFELKTTISFSRYKIIPSKKWTSWKLSEERNHLDHKCSITSSKMEQQDRSYQCEAIIFTTASYNFACHLIILCLASSISFWIDCSVGLMGHRRSGLQKNWKLLAKKSFQNGHFASLLSFTKICGIRNIF